MIINPKKAVEAGWVKNIDEKAVQQNGIDLRLDRLFAVDATGDPLILHKDEKSLPNLTEQYPMEYGLGSGGLFSGWYLQSLVAYQMLAMESIDIPSGACAEIVGRSTLNRSGIFFRSALYDSGFSAPAIQLAIFPFASAYIERGARVCQIIFYEADSASLYQGEYKDKVHDDKGVHS